MCAHLVHVFHDDVPEDVDDGDPDEEDHHGEDQDLQHESVW